LKIKRSKESDLSGLAIDEWLIDLWDKERQREKAEERSKEGSGTKERSEREREEKAERKERGGGGGEGGTREEEGLGGGGIGRREETRRVTLQLTVWDFSRQGMAFAKLVFSFQHFIFFFISLLQFSFFLFLAIFFSSSSAHFPHQQDSTLTPHSLCDCVRPDEA
jgi:hypothetical protein